MIGEKSRLHSLTLAQGVLSVNRLFSPMTNNEGLNLLSARKTPARNDERFTKWLSLEESF
jgi:hypothetical protein